MDEIFEVGALEAYIILKNKKPLGRYWMINETKFTAIDNTKGETLAEDFDEKETMMEWFELDYSERFAKQMSKEAGLINEQVDGSL